VDSACSMRGRFLETSRKFWFENKKKENLGGLGVDGIIILKRILKK
jgi:hypothetical protein